MEQAICPQSATMDQVLYKSLLGVSGLLIKAFVSTTITPSITLTNTQRLEEMPSFQMTENISYEILWDDSDLPSRFRSSTLAKNSARTQSFGYISKSERRIAGSKRAEKYRATQGYKPGDGQVLQSITASPALKHSSFEELRLECYLQSNIAKGCPPSPVDPVQTPWAVIPPRFNAFKDNNEDTDADVFLSDVIMKG